jgi:hypothetical protein
MANEKPKPWKVMCMGALARYYEAQAVVEAELAALNRLGLTEGNFDVSNMDAEPCSCGAWVSRHKWVKPTGPILCGDCQDEMRKVRAAVAADAREEKGLPREEPEVVAVAAPLNDKEMPF